MRSLHSSSGSRPPSGGRMTHGSSCTGTRTRSPRRILKDPCARPERLRPGVPSFNDTLVEIPEVRYAKTDDGVHIAYQVTGDGPFDLVFVTGLFSQVEHHWEEPGFARFLHRLASFARLIAIDT